MGVRWRERGGRAYGTRREGSERRSRLQERARERERRENWRAANPGPSTGRGVWGKWRLGEDWSWISLGRLVAAAGREREMYIYIAVARRGAAVAVGQNEVGGECWFQREGGFGRFPTNPAGRCWPPHRRRPRCGEDTTG